MDSNISQSQSDENEAKRVQEEQRLRDVLATILDTAARERRMCSLLDLYVGPNLWDFSVSRIALVSPERSKRIESIIIQMAQSGQLRGRVSEEQLIGLLDQVNHLICGLCSYEFSSL